MTTDQLDLFTLARPTDPATSHDAAASLRMINITRTRSTILSILAAHPDGLTDQQIADVFPTPFHSPSGLRTRRSELVAAGLVVDSGRRARTRANRATIVWTVAP